MFCRNVLSQGGAEAFTAASLVGHVNDQMLRLTSRRLRLLPRDPPAAPNNPGNPGNDDQDGGEDAGIKNLTETARN